MTAQQQPSTGSCPFGHGTTASRRSVVKSALGAGAAGAAIAAGAVTLGSGPASAATAESAAVESAAAPGSGSVAFQGTHQAGIATSFPGFVAMMRGLGADLA